MPYDPKILRLTLDVKYPDAFEAKQRYRERS